MLSKWHQVTYPYLSNKHRVSNKRRGQLKITSEINVEGGKVSNNRRGSRFEKFFSMQNLYLNV